MTALEPRLQAIRRVGGELRVALNQERNQQAQGLGTLLSEQTAWVAPELLQVGAGP